VTHNWITSSLSSGGDNCVQVSFGDDGTVYVRDSKLGDDSPVLEFTPGEWSAFEGGIVNGDFANV
jgi:hypothetical protein